MTAARGWKLPVAVGGGSAFDHKAGSSSPSVVGSCPDEFDEYAGGDIDE